MVLKMLPHVIGLAGVGLIVWGVSAWLGWEAGAIVGGSPFAGFWIWGEARKVTRGDRGE